MITELNEKQTEGLAIVRDEFIARGTSTKQLADAYSLVPKFANVYAAAGLEAPKEVILVDSPIAIIDYAKKNYGVTVSVSDMCYGSQDAGWLSLYEYFRRYAPEVTGLDDIEGLISLTGEISFYAPFDTVVIASRNPTTCRLESGVLHSTEGPAVEYADGFACYSLFGTQVTKEILEMVQNKDAKGILAIQNTEQRLVAMRAAGAGALLESLESSVLDTYEHWYGPGTLREGLKGITLQAVGFTPEETKEPEYTLYSVMLDGESERILKMRNPSEPKWHYEWVQPDCNTVEAAMRFRMPAAVRKDGTFRWPGAKA